MATYGFRKIIGTAAEDDATRHIVKEGDQIAEVIVGWLKVAVVDTSGQISDGGHFRPLYKLGTVEETDQVPEPPGDADNRLVPGHFPVADDADDRFEDWINVVVTADVDDADER